MKGNSREGFVLSILLHSAVAAGAVVFALVRPAEKPPLRIFELVSPPPPGEAAEAVDDGSLQFELPEARPAPVPPRPKPAQQKPKPKPQPAPVQQPAAPPTPPKPKALTYEEFVRQHGAPKAPATKPKAAKPVAVPRINTNFNANLRDFVVDADRVGSLTDAERSIMASYIGRLMGALRRVWDVPGGLPPDIEAVVEVDIAPNGAFTRVRIVRGSGQAAFDQSVIDTFTTLGSAGPTPEGKALLLRIPFNLKED
jgi:TonB family protein